MTRRSRHRRQFTAALLAIAAAGLGAPALALTEADAAAGVRAALDRAAVAAVALLGRTDGFYGDRARRIGLPRPLDAAAKVMKATGQGRRVDELVLAINRAAETAVAGSLDLLRDAVRSMSVEDALGIVRGGDTAVTQFFERKTRAALAARLRPVVDGATRRHALAEKYDAVASRVAGTGLLRREQASVEAYVTEQALDGLYRAIGDEERRIRRDPVGTGSALLRLVFGR